MPYRQTLGEDQAARDARVHQLRRVQGLDGTTVAQRIGMSHRRQNEALARHAARQRPHAAAEA